MTQVLSSQLYGITATDPWTFAVVSTLLLAVAYYACSLPAHRAGRTDPIAVLRAQ